MPSKAPESPFPGFGPLAGTLAPKSAPVAFPRNRAGSRGVSNLGNRHSGLAIRGSL